jgi:outer membrane protein assembly factor BamB
MKRKLCVAALATVLCAGLYVSGQTKPTTSPAAAAGPVAPEVLPGKGLAEHDFFYAGESRDRKMYIVKKGEVVWSYDDPTGKGEISDAVMLSNGNILLAHQFAVEMISPDKKVLWNYDAPKGCEVHTAVPIGKDYVLFIQNGPAPFLRVVNITTGETKTEFPLPVKTPKSTHGQFRHARLTAAGTIMVAHMDAGKVCEYDSTGKELWSLPAPGVWGVTPLPNGNIIVTDTKGWHEIDHDKKTVWELTKADLPDYKLANLQLAWRLPNGNTLVNTWVNEWNGKIDRGVAPVQAIEVTPDKKVVWALRAWTPPVDLGPATTIQILDTPQALEDVRFGDIK